VRFLDEAPPGSELDSPTSVLRILHETAEDEDMRGSLPFKVSYAARKVAKHFLSHGSLADDWMEPPNFDLSEDAVETFARTAADVLLSDGRGLAEAYPAAAELEHLRAECPRRCQCLEAVIDRQEWDENACNAPMVRKYKVSYENNLLYYSSCDARCRLLEVLAPRLKLHLHFDWCLRDWARGISASRMDVDGSADAVGQMDLTALVEEGLVSCPKARAREFAGVVAEELGPPLLPHATDAVWAFLQARGCGASSADASSEQYRPVCSCFREMHRHLVKEEVRDAYHDHCGMSVSEVHCALRNWARQDVCSVLASAGAEPLIWIFGADLEGEVRAAARVHCLPAAPPEASPHTYT